MATVKDYTVRLNRLRSTRKLTKTMKMVSANKLRKAQEMLKHAQKFSERVDVLLRRLVCPDDLLFHPLLRAASPTNDVLLLVITSDRGLCAGFNNNLIRTASRWMKEKTPTCRRVHLSFHGRRGFYFFRREPLIRKYYEGVSAKPVYGDVRRIAREIQAAFVSKRFDEVHVAYNTFKNVLAQTPTIERLLPLKEGIASASGARESDRWIVDPSQAALADVLLTKVVATRLYWAILNSAVGEHGARMTAMDNATNSSDELIEKYTILRNWARQAAITRELLDIVGGAEALK